MHAYHPHTINQLNFISCTDFYHEDVDFEKRWRDLLREMGETIGQSYKAIYNRKLWLYGCIKSNFQVSTTVELQFTIVEAL